MGNRAAVAFVDTQTRKPQTYVYMHWNGGPESVYAIFDVMKEKNRMSHSAEYSTARFCHLACEILDGDGLSVGVMPFVTIMDAANMADDHGLYVYDMSTGKVDRYMPIGYAKAPRKLTRAETETEERMARKHKYWENDVLRNELRAAIQNKPSAAPELLAALESLFKHCVMIHKHWGEGSNQREADAAIECAHAAIAKARGQS